MAAQPDNNLETARQLLASALEMELSAIADNAAIDTLASWDSLAHMRLVLSLEQHLGKELSPNNVVGLGSLADIVDILDGKELRS